VSIAVIVFMFQFTAAERMDEACAQGEAELLHLSDEATWKAKCRKVSSQEHKDAKKEGRAVDLGLHLYLHDLVTIEGMLAIDRRAAARSPSSSSS
jgi:hypothetical protein